MYPPGQQVNNCCPPKNKMADCSSEYDNIPMRLIQPVIEYIVSPLTHIINSCTKNNVFPQTWKVARIRPIPKTDNHSENNDYRPRIY